MKVTINGKIHEFDKEMTILEACGRIGIKVPTLCHLKGMTPSGSCRICIVEDCRTGRLVPSCAQPIADGTEVITSSERIWEARKLIVELLIANHTQDCLTCGKSFSCELQKLAADLGAEPRPNFRAKRCYEKDCSSPSIWRDPGKCIICGRCVRVCEEVQSIGAVDFSKRGFETVVLPAFNDDLASTTCVNCGQCVKVCPTGALVEADSLREVIDALRGGDRIAVAQIAPAVRVALGEALGVDMDNAAPLLVDALHKIGFRYVFDTNFAADLTIMEEGTELISRLSGKGPLPMITSCSPGWIKFIEHFYPEMLSNLSTCKSPQQMQGAVIKGWWAKTDSDKGQLTGIDPGKVFVVSIMPCTAKKFEAQRPEMEVDGLRDVDAVLTTREAVRLLHAFDVDLAKCEPAEFDNPLGGSTGAGMIFGATGGVTEAALRTVHSIVTGRELERIDLTELRGFDGIKEAEMDLDGKTVRIAVASGLNNARKVLDLVRTGEKQYDFIEIMACPGGCLNGGGQPFSGDQGVLARRLERIYRIDSGQPLRKSHENPWIKELYEKFLGSPGSGVSHRYLHTHYTNRDGSV